MNLLDRCCSSKCLLDDVLFIGNHLASPYLMKHSFVHDCYVEFADNSSLLCFRILQDCFAFAGQREFWCV